MSSPRGPSREFFNKVKHDLRRSAQRLGFDLVRYPLHNPLARTSELIQHHRVDCIVDVGANDGGFAEAIRGLGYTGRIASFEPLSEPFKILHQKADTDPKWDVLRYAVGDFLGEVTVNVSGNRGLSSSVLPMLDVHTDAAPNSRYVGTEKVPQIRLDDMFTELGIRSENRVFLKIDVQGYEKQVLEGASQSFTDGLIVGMQLEMSLVPLYRGAMTYREVLDYADRLGMMLMGLDPVFADPESGRLLQADAVFFR